jgi:hypothetical protein
LFTSGWRWHYNGQFKVVAKIILIGRVSKYFLETMPGMLAGLTDQNQMQATCNLFGMAIVEF